MKIWVQRRERASLSFIRSSIKQVNTIIDARIEYVDRCDHQRAILHLFKMAYFPIHLGQTLQKGVSTIATEFVYSSTRMMQSVEQGAR